MCGFISFRQRLDSQLRSESIEATTDSNGLPQYPSPGVPPAAPGCPAGSWPADSQARRPVHRAPPPPGLQTAGMSSSHPQTCEAREQPLRLALLTDSAANDLLLSSSGCLQGFGILLVRRHVPVLSHPRPLPLLIDSPLSLHRLYFNRILKEGGFSIASQI